MHSEIKLLVLQVQNCFSRSISVIISNKNIAYLSKEVWGSAVRSPSGV